MIKNTGEKPKNKLKREKEEYLKQQLEIAEGRFNEGKAIDIGDINNMIMDMDDVEISEEEGERKEQNVVKNKKKEKDVGMDIDDMNSMKNVRKVKKTIRRNGHRHKQKSLKHMKF